MYLSNYMLNSTPFYLSELIKDIWGNNKNLGASLEIKKRTLGNSNFLMIRVFVFHLENLMVEPQIEQEFSSKWILHVSSSLQICPVFEGLNRVKQHHSSMPSIFEFFINALDSVKQRYPLIPSILEFFIDVSVK